MDCDWVSDRDTLSQSQIATEELLYEFLVTLSSLISNDSTPDKIESSFYNYFEKKSVEERTRKPSGWSPEVEQLEESLQGLQDNRLKEALWKVTKPALFLFKLDKPNAEVSILIESKGVQPKEGHFEGKRRIDCTVQCSTAILTSILTGNLDPKKAVADGHLIVDHMDKLVLFGSLFKISNNEFKEFQKKYFGYKDMGPDSMINLSTKKFLSQVLGEDNRVVTILKYLKSATISPAIIELKFALGSEFMTKDVVASWKFDIIFQPMKIIVISSKQEQELKGLFVYEWQLGLQFERSSLNCLDISLFVSRIEFLKSADEGKEKVLKILSRYNSPPTYLQ
jgi:putative sterol carrier protein